jgi:hypothetical protein
MTKEEIERAMDELKTASVCASKMTTEIMSVTNKSYSLTIMTLAVMLSSLEEHHKGSLAKIIEGSLLITDFYKSGEAEMDALNKFSPEGKPN